jgi:uncharacterized protein DUF4190
MTYPAHEPPPSDDQPARPYQQDPYAQQYAYPQYQQYPPQPYPQYYGPAYPYARPEHDGLAIASLVVSCAAALGLCTYGIGGVLGIVGAILGHVARSRLKHNGRQGAALALAGIIVGWVLAAISVAIATVIVVLLIHDTRATNSTPI